jgi:membrane associated rhomboid family serine protease
MLEDAKRIYDQKTIEVKYIIINAVVFLLIKIATFVQFAMSSSFDFATDALSLPASLGTLAYKPWTIFTYMFTHVGIWHLVSNAIWLYFGGRIFADLLGRDKFIKTYWMGGIMGGLFYLIAYNLAPPLIADTAVLMGASASVIAIFIATAVSFPNYTVMLPVIGPAKLKYIAIVFIIIALPLTHGNEGGHIAHFGGLTWGILWALYLKKGLDIGSWFYGFMNWFGAFGKPKERVSRSRKKSNKRNVRSEKRKNDLPNQHEIDRILDKVGKSGYESLSKEEKNILFNASK